MSTKPKWFSDCHNYTHLTITRLICHFKLYFVVEVFITNFRVRKEGNVIYSWKCNQTDCVSSLQSNMHCSLTNTLKESYYALDVFLAHPHRTFTPHTPIGRSPVSHFLHQSASSNWDLPSQSFSQPPRFKDSTPECDGFTRFHTRGTTLYHFSF